MANLATPETAALTPVLSRLKSGEIRHVDLKALDLFGRWRHITLPAHEVDEETFRKGVPFDGSSFPGYRSIEESDMLMLPDPETAFVDPFSGAATLSLLTDIYEPNGTRYGRDPRGVAQRAAAYLRATGVADTAYFGPELEFFIFDGVRFELRANASSYAIDSAEAEWAAGEAGAMGQAFQAKAAYFATAPQDQSGPVRNAMADALEAAGIVVERHHHEVGGPGQGEMNIRFADLVGAADNVLKVKYIVRNVAHQHGRTATFMPKPVFGENGSGMHVHQSLFLNGANRFYDADGYAGLSALARAYIAGILSHGPALVALTNPTTNSYKRLVPGYEAPIYLAFSSANRSAAIRVPVGVRDAKGARIEFRTPDASCNPYLAFAAVVMAGLDGIERGLEPERLGFGPVEKDIYHLPAAEAAKLRQVPGSLAESLNALEEDHAFLLKGGVFSEDLIAVWIREKREEARRLAMRPTPEEFALYFTA
ncbi:MAG: type I glutamate--ammonia ligase [Firmicutes bacterium]|nr:type I glutamate--ammonia ligase [Bacillota bacterium]